MPRFKSNPRVFAWFGTLATVVLATIWIAGGWWSLGWTARSGAGISTELGHLNIFGPESDPHAGFQLQRHRWPPRFWRSWRWVPNQTAWLLEVPMYAPTMIFALPTIALWGVMLRRARRSTSQCPACGYDRQGLAPTKPCPECGRPPTPIPSNSRVSRPD